MIFIGMGDSDVRQDITLRTSQDNKESDIKVTDR